MIGGHVHDEDVADAAAGAQPGLPGDHRAEQLVGVEAALHEELRLPRPHQFDRLRRCPMAVRRIDDVHPIEGESRLTGDLRDSGGRTHEDRDDQPFRRRLERAGKRRRFAGVHDRGRHRRERTAALQQLLVLACSGLSRHGVTGTNAGAGRRAAGPVSLRRSVRTIASATP